VHISEYMVVANAAAVNFYFAWAFHRFLCVPAEFKSSAKTPSIAGHRGAESGALLPRRFSRRSDADLRLGLRAHCDD